MPGFNQQTINAKVLTANQTSILVGHQPIGFGQTLGVSVSYGTEEFYGVGSTKPQEIQQMKASISITLSALKLTSVGLNALGQPQTWLQVLSGTEFTFNLTDNQGNTLLAVVGATAGSYSSSVPANQPITEDISFSCMDILDGDGNSMLNFNDAFSAASLATSAVSFVTSSTNA